MGALLKGPDTRSVVDRTKRLNLTDVKVNNTQRLNRLGNLIHH